MTSKSVQPMHPNDAVVADIQESANIMMVEKAKKAAEIARLKGIIAGLEESRDKLVMDNQALKKKLADNGIALDTKEASQE